MSYLDEALGHFGLNGQTAGHLVSAMIAAELYSHETQPSLDELVRYLMRTEGLKSRCAWEVVRYLLDIESPQLAHIERPEGELPQWKPSPKAWADPLAQKEGAA